MSKHQPLSVTVLIALVLSLAAVVTGPTVTYAQTAAVSASPTSSMPPEALDDIDSASEAFAQLFGLIVAPFAPPNCECLEYIRLLKWPGKTGVDYAYQLNDDKKMADRGYTRVSLPVRDGIVVFQRSVSVYTKRNEKWERSSVDSRGGHIGWITTTPSQDRDRNSYFNLRDANSNFPGYWRQPADKGCTNIHDQNMKLPSAPGSYSYWKKR